MGDSAETSTSEELSWNLPEEEAVPRSRRGDDAFGVGTLIAGRYKLYKRLGKGAVGTVWEAYDQKLARPVALKLIRTDCDSEMADRFVREAKAAAALQTVHVVAVHDNGEHQGVPYIVMEPLEGETVSDVLERNGQLRLEQVASLLMQCAAALHCAHERGIIHRDLKPANLFVSRSEDGYETIKLLDFGVAKQPDDDATRDATESGVILGTPHYMSPEQARAVRGLDHRTDLWSLSVILYRALTGERPWTAAAAVDVLLKICSEKAVPPTEHRPDLPETVDAFFARAFAENVEERFQSVNELRDAFLEATQMQSASLRDSSSSALNTGQFVAWDSATDIPRPRLSDTGAQSADQGKAPSIPSVSGVHESRALGTLSVSSSVRDFEETARTQRRSRLAVGAVVTMLVGGVAAVVMLGASGESTPSGAARTEPAASTVPAATPGDSTSAAPSASGLPATAKPSASSSASRAPQRSTPRVAPRRLQQPLPPAPAPTTSPDGKKRLPLY